MPDHDLDRPVKIIFGPVMYVVTNTKQAAELLLSKWPMESGQKAHAAKRALLTAMGVPRSPMLIKKARKAFTAAAAEADILMPDR